MALPATDDFNNTTGGSLVLTAYSSNWTLRRGSFIVSNTADDCRSTTSGTTCLGYWNADTFDANQRITGVISAATAGTYPGLAGRIQAGSETGYYLLVSDDYWELGRIDSGTESTLASGTGTIAINDLVRLVIETIDASTVQLRYYHAPAATPATFTQRGSYDDTSGSRITTAGAAGVSGYSDNTSTSGITTWEGANLSGGGGGGGITSVQVDRGRSMIRGIGRGLI